MALVILLALFLALFQQLEEKDMETESPAEQNRIRFELASGSLEVDINALQKMKAAMLSFLSRQEAEFPPQYLEVRDYFRQELEHSACWVSEESAEVGVWRVENQGGHLVLVRYPPPGNEDMYIFHAMLEMKDFEWEVISFEHERELGPE